jgi:hypothetical protein
MLTVVMVLSGVLSAYSYCPQKKRKAFPGLRLLISLKG